MIKILKALSIVLPLILSTEAVRALPIGLSLGIDGSSSISSSDFGLQQDAYANVLASALIPTDSTIAVGVWQFSSGVQQEYAFTVIDSQATKDSLVASIQGMSQLRGSTNIGGTIQTAAQAMIDFGLANLDKSIVDVSTDGGHNTGPGPLTTGPQAITDGIDVVNCLGVGGGANCNFETGTGAFEILVDDFAGFETALRRKIGRETGQEPVDDDPTGQVPEPSNLALFAIGFMGLRVFRRR